MNKSHVFSFTLPKRMSMSCALYILENLLDRASFTVDDVEAVEVMSSLSSAVLLSCQTVMTY